MPIPTALTIAGSDPSGGAGLQADLKTFHTHDVFGMSAVTLLTVQNTTSVSHVEVMSPDLVVAQLRAVLDDIPPAAIKTGALGKADVIHAVADEAERFHAPLVIDPVMISKHGDPLLAEDAVGAIRERLLPLATVVTPNRYEAAALSGLTIETTADLEPAARAIADLGAKAVVVKGSGIDARADDLLFTEGRATPLAADRIDSRELHGSGCVFAASLCANLALGRPLEAAVRAAKLFVTRAIATAPGLGRGHGPTNMLVAPDAD